MDLHYSQTVGRSQRPPGAFHYLMDLHYSQTIVAEKPPKISFTTLWIYTILKLGGDLVGTTNGFTTLWIYTILKLNTTLILSGGGFTTLWIYTILKLMETHSKILECFTTLWIYTILKRKHSKQHGAEVSLPYGFTLFSNTMSSRWTAAGFHYLMDLHYSQTKRRRLHCG